MKNIFDLTHEYAEIESLLIESEGELTPEMETRLAINREELTAKGEGYYAIIRKNKAEAEMIATEIKRLTGLKKTRENTIEQLKDRLHQAMRVYDIKKLPMLTGSITLCQREVVDVVNEEELPIEYRYPVTTYKTEKDEINKAVKEGKEVPGTAKSTTTYLLIK